MSLRNYTTLCLAAALMAVGIPFSDAQTSLNPGGKLSVAADWTSGIPTPANPGTIAVDGIFDSTLGTTNWGRESQVAHTAGNLVGTGTNGFNPTRGVTWNMSGGSITGRFVTANASIFNMSGGFITIRNDAGTRAIQAANDGIWNISGTFTIDATFASTDPFIQAVTGPGTGSTYNFLSGWTGSWTHGTMSGDEWRTYVTTHPEFKLNGTPITTAIFDANFSVNNGGMTLSLLATGPGKGPITVYLLGGQSNMTGSAYLEDLPADFHTIPELLLYVGEAPNIRTLDLRR